MSGPSSDATQCPLLTAGKALLSRIVAPRHFVMRSKPMADDIAVLRAIYNCFNARDIDGVLDALTDDVAWANGMEGGYVHGREGVREYWMRQWAIVSPPGWIDRRSRCLSATGEERTSEKGASGSSGLRSPPARSG